MAVKVGIPSALLYYIYYPMWQVFFNEIGVQAVTSGKTTKDILNNGVREALADACVPVKLFFGHVMELKDRVDYLFIPRVVCLNRKTIYCPKFLGLPDMIRHSVDGLPPIIDVRIDTREGHFAVLKAFLEIGKLFQAGKFSVYQAYFKACRSLNRYHKLLRHGFTPQEAINMLFRNGPLPRRAEADLKFAVIGYPYNIYDNFISVNFLDKLRRLGVAVITPENISPFSLERQKNCGLPKRLFWTFSDRALKAAHFLLQRGQVDGMLHLTAFGCGPDSLLNKFVELEAKKHRNIPFMTLMIDEHTGEAGMATRLEAFVDMVRRRKEALACRK